MKKPACPVWQPLKPLYQLPLGNQHCSGQKVFSEGKKEGQKHDQGTEEGVHGGGHALQGGGGKACLPLRNLPSRGLDEDMGGWMRRVVIQSD